MKTNHKYSNDSSIFNRTNYVNLAHGQHCAICDKPDWCQTLEGKQSGRVEAHVCRRPEHFSREPEIEIDGAGVFLLDSASQTRPTGFQYQVKPKSQRNKAQSKVQNRIYKRMQAQLRLKAEHRDNLLDRGLDEAEIKRLGYRSLPETHAERIELMKAMSPDQADLLAVAGFYLSDKDRVWITHQNGMWIPCRDVEGKVIGGQVRSDTNTDSRYKWFSASSSKRKRGGVSSGSPIHVAKWEGDNSTVWITEGLLKADVTSSMIGQTVIGVAGVNSYKKAELVEVLRQLGAEQVVIAFDADYESNPTVKKAINDLARLLVSHHFSCQVATWDIDEGKGIDDLLANGRGYNLSPMSASLDMGKVRATPMPTEQDGVISFEKVKRVRIAPVKIEIETSDLSLTQVRQQIPERINDYLSGFSGNGQTLLMRVTQGVGKTTSSLQALIEQPDWRVVLASPRHLLLEEAIAKHQLDDWTHIRPRRPRNTILQEWSADRGLDYLKWMRKKAQTEQKPIHTNQFDILCHRHDEANKLASQNWNVIQNLCSSGCEIGLSGSCAYFRQYQMPESMATVHETLFIERFCQDIFQDRVLNPQQVVVMDEPDPNKFVRSTNISLNDLNHTIGRAWSDELKQLLKVIRSAVENNSLSLRLSQKSTLIGREAMEAIALAAGGQEELGQMLEDADAETPSKHRTVVVGIDAFLGVTARAYQVQIGHQELYIPQSVSSPKDNGEILVEANYALREQLPIIRDYEKEEELIPLNYLSDLLRTLNKEFQLYAEDQDYNSALVITMDGIRLNLRQYCKVPMDVPMVLLDGQGNADLMSELLGREVKLWSAPISPKVQISQIVDGVYGITSLWNSSDSKPKPTLLKLMEKVILPACQHQPEELLIVSWKKVADYLRKLQAEGQISAEVGIEHYGNLKGTNQHQERQRCILLGTPSVGPADLEEQVNALLVGSEEPISMETELVWKHYNYQDWDGQQYQALVRQYVDSRVEMVARLHREDEMVQAAHRIRGVNNDDRQILIISQLPIEELKATSLTTLQDYASGQGQETDEVESGLDWLLEDRGYFSANQLKSLLSERTDNSAIKNTIYSRSVERQSQSGFPSFRTLERRVERYGSLRQLGRSRINVYQRGTEQGGGATWCYVYHDGPLTEAQIEAIKVEYKELTLKEKPELTAEQVWVSVDQVVVEAQVVSIEPQESIPLVQNE